MVKLNTALCGALLLSISIAEAGERPTVVSDTSIKTLKPILINQADELAAWQQIENGATSTDILMFLNKYPQSEFASQARDLFVDALAAERGSQNAEPDVAETMPATQEPQAQDEAGVRAESTPTAEPVAVSFSAPLTQGDAAIVGKSLEELIKGSPLFPPVEGLPESYWKNEECSACHQWEQANLCTQANTYLSEAGSANLTKQHPYGGTFKQNLRVWADGGCE
ncbi:hypothetical protein [Yoonia sediminilitoris]|uniref:Uncharacterized protein n=1 Tax=Yoonia sediminilitoris TaxID=1286148 RepID=A0A2T6KAF2_9RHOB|nr:hypothetical protein [Yoonia sediminilitoris]PUB11825.1 hypothetical protein C8N45_11268 [Yoonia sediminilitoris]RCW91902.1 hypothetical protein DFP92_11268 [Yoonia sediminilitoris]